MSPFVWLLLACWTLKGDAATLNAKSQTSLPARGKGTSSPTGSGTVDKKKPLKSTYTPKVQIDNTLLQTANKYNLQNDRQKYQGIGPDRSLSGGLYDPWNFASSIDSFVANLVQSYVSQILTYMFANAYDEMATRMNMNMYNMNRNIYPKQNIGTGVKKTNNTYHADPYGDYLNRSRYHNYPFLGNRYAQNYPYGYDVDPPEPGDAVGTGLTNQQPFGRGRGASVFGTTMPPNGETPEPPEPAEPGEGSCACTNLLCPIGYQNGGPCEKMWFLYPTYHQCCAMIGMDSPGGRFLG